ncbi:MAG: fasciclin domain-containing protein [Sphingomonadaceae bacterium]|jgi:uncharacterized surface protein with fasciclin (FAS1) repeats
MKNTIWLASIAATALALGGCERVEDGEAAPATENTADQTLTASISQADGLSTVAGVITEANLASVFDGSSAYTVLAPTDDAFAELGDAAEQLTPDGDTAPMIALLRNHIVPGHLRPDDLRTALADDEDGEVEMASVGSDLVTFRMDGDTLVARGPDGAQVRLLVDRAVEANNGVLIPVDGILRRLPTATTASR